MKKTFWLSYDLGLKGDYEGFYRFLDNVKAEERGTNLALVKRYPFDTLGSKDADTDFKTHITREIEIHAALGKSDRVYLIWRSFSDDNIKGAFLFGRSKAAPWTGYADAPGEGVDSDSDDL